MQITIKPGAIFIADAHANKDRNEFFDFLNLVRKDEIRAPQLFLLGDMFEFLSAKTEYFADFFAPYVRLIDELGQKIEIYYFEGNHDYELTGLFKNVKIYPLRTQPVIFKTEFNQSVAVAHGDLFLPLITKYALLFLRTNIFLKTINFLDKLLGFKISKKILSRLFAKKLDYKIANFEEVARRRMIFYDADVAVEGHFHQGKEFYFARPSPKLYVNLSAFACEQSYFIVEYAQQKIKFVRKDVRGQNV